MTALVRAYRALKGPRVVLTVILEDIHRVRVAHEGWHGVGKTLDEAVEDMLRARDAAMTGTEECKACAVRTGRGFDGQCPACAKERTRAERAMETK